MSSKVVRRIVSTQLTHLSELNASTEQLDVHLRWKIVLLLLAQRVGPVAHASGVDELAVLTLRSGNELTFFTIFV